VAFGKYLLLPAIPVFSQRYPDISLEVRFNDRFVYIAAEHVDVAVRVGKITSPDIIARRISASRLLTCASPKYLAQAGMPRTPEDLRKHRLLGHLRGDANRPADWQFKQGDGTRSLRLPMALSFNTVDALTISALEGAGLAASATDDGGYVVDAEPDAVGRAALAGGVALTHLSPSESAGLEQLFFDLTEGAPA